MASQASTSAGRRRSAQRAAARNGHARSGNAKSAPKRRKSSAQTRKPAKRPATRTRAQKRPPKKRAPARTQPPKRPAKAIGRRLPSLRTGLVLAVLVVAALAAGYFAWLRDSSLVAVRDVKVSGLSSPDQERIEEALTTAAREMTTLHVRESELKAAVAGFPTVVSVSADANLLHGLEIRVRERPPVLVAASGGQTVPVAADGTLLRGVELGDAGKSLPLLEAEKLPSGGRLAGADLEQALVLGATPAPLRPLIEGVSLRRGHGVEVTMTGGIPIRFGPSSQAAAKWAAAASVLADPKLDTLTYVDVRVPDRPAVGGAAAPTALAPEPVPVEPEVVPEEVVPVAPEVAADPAAPVDPAL